MILVTSTLMTICLSRRSFCNTSCASWNIRSYRLFIGHMTLFT